MKNDTNLIRELLEKYYECIATLDEEQILKEYFTGGNVADDLMLHKPQFVYYSHASVNETLADDFELKFLSKIKDDNDKPVGKIFKISRRFIYSAAAVLLVSVSMTWLISRNLTSITVTGNEGVEKSEFALEQTLNALNLISETMDNTTDHLMKLEIINRGFEQFDQFEKLEYLNDYLNKNKEIQ
jgi:hypothetical protein